MKNKDLSFQAFRGLAIIAVVAIHASGINDETEWNYGFSMIFRQFVNFVVPVFIFISGYFTPIYEFTKLSDYLDFYQKRLSRILIPYVVWCALIILFYKHNYQWHWSKIVIDMITGKISGPYYFIILLVQLILLTPLMAASTKSTVKNFLWLSLSPLSLLGLYFSSLHLNYDIHFPWYALPFTVWVGFYYLGLLANKSNLNIKNRNIRKIILLYIGSIVLAIIEALLLWKIFNLTSFANSQVKASSFLSSFLLILLFLAVREKINNWPRVLIIIGEFSFGIYLFHMPVLDLMSRITNKFGFQNFWIAQLLINSCGVIALCCFVITIVRKVTGVNFSQKYLGM
ncbi:hypothetical protein NIES2100_50010 [Calothrix sp. NIES-2100]|uniref:acyltransferase n=1 Tax=Calothrix sp. NIES-2100 TaxID=1954172 RepID=UPI000B604989|nr:hypothetical protein NIES2100_50010 [Calothrix sp. NIES-2100]